VFNYAACVFQFGEQVDGLIVLFDLEHVGMQHLWKPGEIHPLLSAISSFCLKRPFP